MPSPILAAIEQTTMALVAPALLIAESKPAERDLMVRLVLGLLEDSGATIEREPRESP